MVASEPIGVSLDMQDLAVIKETFDRLLDQVREANKPFGYITTYEAENRILQVRAKIRDARCEWKMRNSPQYNPAGDSECSSFATDEQSDAWAEAHPEPEAEPGMIVCPLCRGTGTALNYSWRPGVVGEDIACPLCNSESRINGEGFWAMGPRKDGVFGKIKDRRKRT